MRTIESEFPDFDGEHLNIPPFVAEPWHNDACPRYSYREDPFELTLWTDYKDPSEREIDGPQYTLCVSRLEGYLVTYFEGETLEEFRGVLEAYLNRNGVWVNQDPSLGTLMVGVGRHAYFSNVGEMR
jgi:hypothetical protein